MRTSPQFMSLRCCGQPQLFLSTSADNETFAEYMGMDIAGRFIEMPRANLDSQSRARCNPRSRFLELPAELRIAIYEYALLEPFKLGIGGFCNKSVSSTPKVFGIGGDAAEAAVQPPLTRVSRQIRRETLPMFYRLNQIMLAIHYRKARGEVDKFIETASATPAIRANLWNVTIKHRFGMLDFRGIVQIDFERFTILPELWYNSIPPMIAREVERIVEMAKDEKRKGTDDMLIVEMLRQLVDILGFSAS